MVELRDAEPIALVLCRGVLVELEPEVQAWLHELPTAQFATAAFYIDMLAEKGPLLGEPYTRQLDGKLGNCGSILTVRRCGSPTGSRRVVGSSCSRCSSSRRCVRRASWNARSAR